MADVEYTTRGVRLSRADGGGYFATVPDLPRCMSNGETPEEAVRNVREATLDWIDAARESGECMPAPRPHPSRA